MCLLEDYPGLCSLLPPGPILEPTWQPLWADLELPSSLYHLTSPLLLEWELSQDGTLPAPAWACPSLWSHPKSCRRVNKGLGTI